MKAAPFEYHAPDRLEEALAILRQAEGQAKILAGGQSLVPLMAMGLTSVPVIVDINRIEALAYIRREGDMLAVGALARHTDILEDEAVRSACPLLAEATSYVGHPAIRNRGTLCGSVAHADPAAEQPAVLAALEGTVVVEGAAGRREIPAEAFFLGYLTTALSPDEMIVEVRLPVLPQRTGTSFVEWSRRSGDFALVGAATLLTVEDGICRRARIALTGVEGRPRRAHRAEAFLEGAALDAHRLREAATLVAEGLEAEDDANASAAYRRHLASRLSERALARAWARAEGRA